MPRSLLRATLALAAAAAFAQNAALAQRPKKEAAQAPVYYPSLHEWERKAPEAVGMDPALVKEAVAFAMANESKNPRDLALNHALAQAGEPYNDPVGPFKERGPQTGVIVRHGYLVAEWGEPQRVDMTYSVTKSFVSSVVGLAYDRGLIRDLNDKVKDYVPTEHFASAHNQKITWDHLLRQTSDWEGTLWGKPDWADRPPEDRKTWSAWIGRARNEPGSSWKYNDVRVNLLAFAALQVWRRPLPQVLREHVMEPIGASNTWRWHGYDNSWVELDGQKIQSVSGGGHWGGGMWISARDQARFGLLTLRRGRWKDKQILSEKWIQMATTPTPANTGYGFMNYFLNTDKKMLPSAPASVWQHQGNGPNLIYCDPENDLVIVTRWLAGTRTMDEVVKRVLDSIAKKPGAPSAN